jgi:hypothetical protein
MDEMKLGLVDEDEEVRVPADRAYWEKRGSKATVAMADQVFGWLHDLDPGLELKYNKFYIGLAKDGRSNLFVLLRPQKVGLRVEIRLERSDEIQAQLEAAGLNVIDYDERWGHYRMNLSAADLTKHKALLIALMKQAHGGVE